MKLDILVIAVHPDDAELCCSGTILKHIALGKKVGIVDLTRGELGTRGTAETRDEEAADSAKILGLHVRENLRLRDGFFQNDEFHRLEVIKAIRKYQPEIILSNALEDRHPDHGRAGDLVYDSVFLSGLPKIETLIDGVKQEAHRPRLLLQYIQDRYLKPDIIVDISDHMDKKIESIKAFKTQFYNPDVDDLQTYISSPEFFESVIGRSREFGKSIGATFGEGFTSRKLLGVDNLFDLR
ncbi:bacillithiol biosynthesis deacetylase BshB1 [Pedobacter alluvionis]|uniref:Bacillithiol biosynthesis deacetylase BshB1 n=1 Tax=Pedobacter alluvionis TaxID=475253 RepID=A0A497XTZ8_9SPHI|nr:bacillithiol biosynthesis deacetylase BshB1 [Pedobacter alluvionis]RLJ72918.1 bacillithiol biosynthesis deacetylase BshB1 [Pedobacter alluvionis]TFB29254.1 bacillithiol biosynthesis deacetylase BshB1 [Pedobacter alluvionis]